MLREWQLEKLNDHLLQLRSIILNVKDIDNISQRVREYNNNKFKIYYKSVNIAAIKDAHKHNDDLFLQFTYTVFQF